MVNNPETTADVEIREQYELGMALIRLECNPDFDKVIGGYLTTHLVKASEDMITQGPTRQEALEQVMSVGYLKIYLQGIANDAMSASESLGE